MKMELMSEVQIPVKPVAFTFMQIPLEKNMNLSFLWLNSNIDYCSLVLATNSKRYGSQRETTPLYYRRSYSNSQIIKGNYGYLYHEGKWNKKCSILMFYKCHYYKRYKLWNSKVTDQLA